MKIKEQLIEEIESAPDALLAETLNFLRFLKTKETQAQPTQHQVESPSHIPVNSTGSSLLEHLKTIGTWEGDDILFTHYGGCTLWCCVNNDHSSCRDQS